jgi:hypothetical protein
MSTERCELTELPVDQCGCRLHAPFVPRAPEPVKAPARVKVAPRSFSATFEHAWDRIQRRAGEEFHTSSGLPFTYRVPGDFARITRDGEEIERSLSKTSFAKAADVMPVSGPGALRNSQGSSYTWAILMDPRISAGSW